MEWKRWDDGAGWRYLEDGRIILEEPRKNIRPLTRIRRGEKVNVGRWLWGQCALDADGALRTKGEPRSMRGMAAFHAHFVEAEELTGVPTHWLAAMASIEADRAPGYRWDEVSLRHEPGWKSDESTPGRVSAGVMQTLLRTARECLDMQLAMQEAIGKTPEQLVVEDLHDPRTSILLGATYMAYQVTRGHGVGMPLPAADDLVLLCGSYNAGKLRARSHTPWRIQTFGKTRVPKMVAYHNDYLAVMQERGWR